MFLTKFHVAFRTLGVIVLTALTPYATLAIETTVGGITWTYRLRNGNADIQDFTPKNASVTFPSSLDGYPVTSLSGSFLAYG